MPRLYSLIGLPARVTLRKRHAKSLTSVSGLPVYVIQSDNDLILGTEVVTKSLEMIAANSPLWMSRMRRLMRSVMIIDSVQTTQFSEADRCCMINPWTFIQSGGNTATAPQLAASSMIWSVCLAMLLQGRFGYLGLRHQQTLGLRAQYRFLRKFLSGTNYEDILAAMSLYAKAVDRMLPERPSLYAVFEQELALIGKRHVWHQEP